MNYINSIAKAKYVGLAFLLLYVMTQFSWKTSKGEFNNQIISGDGLGYYQYLVGAFHLKNLDKQELGASYMVTHKDKVVNKYYSGTALFMLPFYKIGEFHSWLVKEKFDPYSPRTLKWINVGALVYFMMALLMLKRWLASFQLKDKSIFFGIVGICLGSNLLLYAVFAPAMSHVYSFFTISGFLLFARRFLQKKLSQDYFLGVLFFGLLSITRPINIIVIVLLPFLARGFKNLIQSFRNSTVTQFVLGIILLFGILFIQSYLWYLQCGSWIIFSYKNEGFYWLKPEVYEVLFGFRKGWFIYTPIALLSSIGLLFIIKRKQVAIYIALFWVLFIYQAAAWWNWFYGPSFGQRVFIDFYALLILQLAFLYQIGSKKRYRFALYIVLLGCITLNAIQTFQFRENIISSWDMNYDKYKETFGKLDHNSSRIGGLRDALPYRVNKNLLTDTVVQFTDRLVIDDEIGKEVLDCSNIEYPITYKQTLQAGMFYERGYFIEVELSRKELSLNSSRDVRFIIEVKDESGKKLYYSWFFMNEVPSRVWNEWKQYRYDIYIPSIKDENCSFSAYLRNEEKANFLISNMHLKVFGLN